MLPTILAFYLLTCFFLMQLLAGLPLSTDEVSAEEQLMLLGLAETGVEASQMITVGQKEKPPPQLYTGNAA